MTQNGCFRSVLFLSCSDPVRVLSLSVHSAPPGSLGSRVSYHITHLLLLLECRILIFLRICHLGASQVLCMQVLLFVYGGSLHVITVASSVARGLLCTISELPHFLFPSRVPAGRSVVSAVLCVAVLCVAVLCCVTL